MSYTSRPATTEEVAANYVGRKAQFTHGATESARRHRGGWVTVQRNKTTAMIQQDENGVFAMRKNYRENLKATFYTLENGKTFISSLRSDYL